MKIYILLTYHFLIFQLPWGFYQRVASSPIHGSKGNLNPLTLVLLGSRRRQLEEKKKRWKEGIERKIYKYIYGENANFQCLVTLVISKKNSPQGFAHVTF